MTIDKVKESLTFWRYSRDVQELELVSQFADGFHYCLDLSEMVDYQSVWNSITHVAECCERCGVKKRAKHMIVGELIAFLVNPLEFTDDWVSPVQMPVTPEEEEFYGG